MEMSQVLLRCDLKRVPNDDRETCRRAIRSAVSAAWAEERETIKLEVLGGLVPLFHDLIVVLTNGDPTERVQMAALIRDRFLVPIASAIRAGTPAPGKEGGR